jgi:Domain of unknown function (DUF1788)
MMGELTKGSLQERFQHLLAVIGSQRFLLMKGYTEVPFFICPFKPTEAVEMERLQKQLANKLGQNGVRVLVVNLYDLSVELLKERGVWEQVLEVESTVSKPELQELLQGMLDPESHLIPAIAGLIERNEFDVLFLSGVAEVFPYIRSHNVLNNLQSTAKDQPTVMFFPGAYTHSLEAGAALELFGRLRDDKYYRAFNIFDYEV